MNNDLQSIHSTDNSTHSGLSKNLDERFADHPLVYQRLQHIADQMDQALEQGFTGDQAEEMAIEAARKLGADMLADWAQARSAQCLEQALQVARRQSIDLDRIEHWARKERPHGEERFREFERRLNEFDRE